ncbi:hypothetical protein J6590_043188 [Homalodisca vitripennis]|nr:hypothetical protein J6590_043188 [Homalodisca vitripennis]
MFLGPKDIESSVLELENCELLSRKELLLRPVAGERKQDVLIVTLMDGQQDKDRGGESPMTFPVCCRHSSWLDVRIEPSGTRKSFIWKPHTTVPPATTLLHGPTILSASCSVLRGLVVVGQGERRYRLSLALSVDENIALEYQNGTQARMRVGAAHVFKYRYIITSSRSVVLGDLSLSCSSRH